MERKVTFGYSLIIFLAFSSFSYTTLADDHVKLKMQSAYQSHLPGLGDTGKFFADSVTQTSSGSITVKFFEPKRLVPPLQIFDAVAAGLIDSGFSWPGYWMGKIAAITMFASIPFGPEAPELLSWLYHGGGLELWREIYARHGLVPVPCGVLPPEASGWFSKPVNSINDISGLKIRFSGLGGEIMKKLGASVTLLSGEDIFLNLERGVIDATEFSLPAIDESLGFYKVVQNYYFPGWHQPASILEFMVNKEVWDSLSDEQRAYINMACGNTILWSMTRNLAIQGPALTRMREQGVHQRSWSPELMLIFRETAMEILDEHSTKDRDFRRARESLEAFLAQTAEWRSIAYVQ